jgi:hypothetical protein
MTNIFKKTILAAVLGLGALTASVPAASAAGLEVTIETVGYRNGFLEVRDHDRGERWGRHGRRDDWGRRHHSRGRCAPGLAIAKARDFGLRRARIADMSPRKVVVDGFRRGGYSRIVFANDRHCPVLWR